VEAWFARTGWSADAEHLRWSVLAIAALVAAAGVVLIARSAAPAERANGSDSLSVAGT
jgi:hypothetical protein